MVNVIRMNGVPVYNQPTLRSKLEEAIEQTQDTVKNLNRSSRRHKMIRRVVAMLAFVAPLGISSLAFADQIDPSITQEPISKGIPERIGSSIVDHMITRIGGTSPTHEPTASLYWQLNKLCADTIFKTQDFFHNPEVVGYFTVISLIAMSASTIVIAKKGWDMIKAKMIGSSSLGTGELILRLLGSVILNFLSLPVMSLGIKASNLLISTLFSNLSSGIIPMSMDVSGILATTFWLCGYMLMFFILLIQYWVRQINLVLLGVTAPIANLAWVTDGGSMLGTVIRETVTHLTTPIAQAIVLSLGTALVTSVAGHEGIGWINSAVLGLSVMFTMIVTPSFVRKFTTGSVNPLMWALNTAVGIKKLPLSIVSKLK